MQASTTHPPSRTRLEVRHARLEVGGHVLEDVVLAGFLHGQPLGDAPIMVLVGGITASPFPFGGDEHEAWWPALRGADRIDPARHTILCPAWPGSGSGFAGFDDEANPPSLSVLDLSDLVAAWLEGIGCDAPVTYVGASLGGLVGVALAVRHPERVGRLVSISAGLRPDGWGTATRHLQRELVRDGRRNGDVRTGMIRARQLGMLTYRSRHELDTRFGRFTPGEDRPPVASYLDHHGARFADRFPVNTFLMLSEAIDRCTLASTAEAMREALARVRADVVVVGVPGDLLFPWSLQNELHRELQAVGARSSLWKLDSAYGHDAFLADQDALAELLVEAGVFRSAPRRSVPPPFDGVGRRPLREIRVGMIGCGVVGTGLLELLGRQRDALARRYGVKFEVTRLAVRDVDKDRGPHAEGIARTADPMSLVADPDVDVVVEVAGGVETIGDVLRACLAAGKPVVTANKALLAERLAALGVLAQRTETPLACEAAAAAALPIIRHLSHRADEVDGLQAIVNGTCNYIITRMEQDELSLEEALREAQAGGFAEADASADLDGHDAAAKLSILCYRSFGVWVRPDELTVTGIRRLTPVDFDLAELLGGRIRHLVRADRVDEGLELGVEPMLLPSWHLLANVEEEYNAVYLRCQVAGDLSFFGKGAGGLPTATAVLGDLIDLALDNSARWPVPRDLPIRRGVSPRRRYLRVSGAPHPGLSRRVESHLRRAGLGVEARGERVAGDGAHHAFLIGACTTESIAGAALAISRLARVNDVLVLGCADG